MKGNTIMKTITNIIYPAFALFAFACFALAPQARAQTCREGCLTNDNTVLGDDALLFNTTGISNTAVGFNTLGFNTTGSSNTATGVYALLSNTTGSYNTANGQNALTSNTTGVNNTATGFYALLNNNADNNTASGFQALYSNTTGTQNTANGVNTLYSNTIGFENTATGGNALFGNSTGSLNTATGTAGLYGNTSGQNNTAIGAHALSSNTTADNNTATGVNALLFNTTGHDNTAEGFTALENNTTGSSNIALGSNAGINLTIGSNNIDIGNAGTAGESQHIRIGTTGIQKKAFIAGISGVTVAGGVGVIVGTNGQLGTVVSSERFKEAIKPIDKASEAILALKPVTFRYKHDLDPEGIPQFGLVAEEVEKVNPDLVARDEQGKPYTVRYEAVNAMLLNEFLKEHRTVQELKSALAKQETTAAQQQKQIEALTEGLQKVSAQLEIMKPTQQTVSR